MFLPEIYTIPFISEDFRYITKLTHNIEKVPCLRAGCHPVIITIYERVKTAYDLADDANLSGRVEVWDIQQFLSSNVYEHSLFDEGKRNAALSDIIVKYNKIVLENETDPSLRIDFEAR